MTKMFFQNTTNLKDNNSEMKVGKTTRKGKNTGHSVGGGANLDNFDPAVYFKYYDRYEVYEDEKMYEYDYEDECIMDYMLSDWRGDELKKRAHYILIKKKWRPTEEEKKLYEKYCQCTVCQSWRINPFRYSACPCCHGCMKASDDRDDVDVRGKTREYLEKKGLL
jgi:hypothetical protein